jgi:1-acyl-sn-glycerol-3-phosphate acyltransferase
MNIPVNRKSNLDSHRAFIRAANDIDKGISIALFPEGTIYHNGPVMGRYKNGPFRLAIEKQVPIVPITFMNNWKLLPDNFHERIGHPGIARVIIHEPIPTKGLTQDDIEKLKSEVRATISLPLRQKYAEQYNKLKPVNNIP